MNSISTSEAIELLKCQGAEIHELMSRAHKLRVEHKGLVVKLCGVVNAKSGMCSEDCKFCAQSVHNNCKVDCYSMLSSSKLMEAAHVSHQNKAGRFGIVTSGLALEDSHEADQIIEAVEGISERGEVMPCGSLGNISFEMMQKLNDAGLTRYHCNLETAESFFKQICTTRPWSDSADTIKNAKKLGMATCSGGLFGLGESLAQRVELLESIRDLEVDCAPINFYNPVPGTQIEETQNLSVLDCIKTIAVARLVMPNLEIRICGGRGYNMKGLQSWALISGADGLMVGDYLTTTGQAIKDDLQMIEDAGFTIDTSGK